MTFKLGLLFIAIIGCFVALNLGLAHDEAYYWMFAKHLDWGYFDHPPMVALFIYLTKWIGQIELGVRLSFIFASVATPFVISKITPAKNKNLVPYLYLASPLLMGAGLLALPDGCLIFFTALYLWAIKDYIDHEKPRSLILLPLAIAGLLNSKYHGVLLVVFTILAHPKIIFKKSFWSITILSSLLMLPHLFWQIQHEFITFKYHFLMRPKASISLKSILDFILVQTFSPALLLGPFFWFKFFKSSPQNLFERILKFNIIGITLFFFISLFSKKFEANWTIFISLLLMTYVLQNNNLVLSLRLIQIPSMIIALVISAIPLLSSHKRMNEFRNWEHWSLDIYEKTKHCRLVTNTYQLASKLNFYGNFSYQIPSINLNSRPNQYDYWTEIYPESDPVCFLTNKSRWKGEKIITPEGKTLTLVNDIVFHDILKLKDKE